jgi:hypothetical protein
VPWLSNDDGGVGGVLALRQSWVDHKWSPSFYIIFAACILVVFGSVRDIVGAISYWVMWAGVGGVGLYEVMRQRRAIAVQKQMLWVCSAYAIMLAGFIISAMVTGDDYTWYQGAKLFCIGLVFIVLFILARELSPRDFYEISRIVICLGFIAFMLCKYVVPEYYIKFGGRQGSRFAYPGVLWKTAIFFSGLVLVKILYDTKKNPLDFVVLGMAVYLLLVDASRTGLLLAVLLHGCLIFVRFRLAALKALLPLMLLAAACYVLILTTDGLGLGLSGKYPVVFDRIFQVDKTRYSLLAAGLGHAENCFVLGCGFGSAFAIKAGEPLVVHNAYLAALGELGIVGFTGFALLMLMPVIFLLGGQSAEAESDVFKKSIGQVAMLGGVSYALSMMLHPMSSELSEWGIWIIMIAWQSAASSSSDTGSVVDKRIF